MPDLNGLAPDPSRFDFDALFISPHGADLPSDGPSNDRTDAALASRFQSFKHADDLNWLLEGTEPAVREGGPAIDLKGGGAAVKPEGKPLRIGPAAIPGLAGAAAMDLGEGAIETPRQIVGGMRDAVQAMLDLGEELDKGNIPGTDIPLSLGGITFTDEEGNFSIDYRGPQEWRQLTEAGDIQEPDLPTVTPASTVTGSVIRSAAQFLTGFRLA